MVVVIALYIDVEEPYYIITYYIQLFTYNYLLSCGKCSSLSPTLRLITLLAFFTQAEQLTGQIKTPLLQNNRNQ